MKIFIVGCGKIGSVLVSNLVAEGHDVTAIDSDPTVINELTNIYDVIGVPGNGVDCDILAEAGVAEAELFAAVTGSDEFNMLSCYIARKMGAKQTLARIRNPEYNDSSLAFLRQHLDLSMPINPERLAARELFHVLRLPSAANVETFSMRNFEMVELKLKSDSALDGLSLIDLRQKYPQKFLVCVVQRGEEVIIPDGNFVLKSGDKVGLTATPAELHKLLKNLGLLKKQARNVMILGASKTAYYLAKALITAGNAVKIIEKNAARCEEFSEKLPDAVIIHGDGAQQELLLEEGLKSMDAFVALTGMDEQNILMSYFAQAQNVPKVIAKVNRDEFAPMAEHLGLDTLVSPRRTVANIIVRYARALENSRDSSVETLYKLMDGKAEALEFIVHNDCELVDIQLKDLPLKSNILIAGIFRNKKILIPAGDDHIAVGDKVVILTTGHRINNLSDILK